MKKSIVLAFLLSSTIAVAEEAHGPESAQPGEHDEHGGHHDEDPSKHFNWFDHAFPYGENGYANLDHEGGPLGDGAMGPEKRPLKEGEEEHPMSVPFVFVLINFGLLLILLGKKAGPMASQMAAKRSDEIKVALEEAARLRSAAKDKLAEYSSKLKQAETEIDDMIKTMRDSAEAERQRIIENAEAQAELLRKDAELRIAAEIERARQTLQQEAVLAAAAVAEKVLREKTTPADHAKLVDTFIKDVTA